MFKIYKHSSDAIIPKRGDIGAAGFDLASIVDACIPPHSQEIIDTGLIFDFPSDCYGRIAPRSGLAAKNSIDTLAGVVDSSYRGTIKVILYNHSDKFFNVKKGDRIAQLIFERIYTPDLIEVHSIADLEDSERGAGGFGSTGVGS